MLDRIANPFRALRERLAAGIDAPGMELRPRLVASVTDPVLVGQTYRNALVAVTVANAPVPLSDKSRVVREVLIIAGPQVDGTTPNVSTIWLGESNVQEANGIPLAPGAHVSQGPCDLADQYIAGAGVGDVVRLRFAE